MIVLLQFWSSGQVSQAFEVDKLPHTVLRCLSSGVTLSFSNHLLTIVSEILSFGRVVGIIYHAQIKNTKQPWKTASVLIFSSSQPSFWSWHSHTQSSGVWVLVSPYLFRITFSRLCLRSSHLAELLGGFIMHKLTAMKNSFSARQFIGHFSCVFVRAYPIYHSWVLTISVLPHSSWSNMKVPRNCDTFSQVTKSDKSIGEGAFGHNGGMKCKIHKTVNCQLLSRPRCFLAHVWQQSGSCKRF